MSTAHACPSCRQINPPEATLCLACGAALSTSMLRAPEASELIIDLISVEIDEDTVPGVHVDEPETRCWFDSHPDALESARAPLDLTLRPLGDLPVLNDVAAAAEQLPPGVVLRTDGDAARPCATPPTLTKAARRATVRRRRLSSDPPAANPTAVPADVLVLEADASACEQLSGLLDAFGFRVHPVQTLADAMHMLDAKHFVAAFLDLTFEGSAQQASIALCRRLKSPAQSAAASALIIVSGSTRPVERVRATLAGSDAFLLKPLTRGQVAQALEACNVALPADSRRR
jgi:CheY-like chemotaxis protein